MQCPNCNNALEDGAVFCGICGNPVGPTVQGATVIDSTGRYGTEGGPRGLPGSVSYGQQSMQSPTVQAPSPQYNYAPPGPQSQYGNPYSPPPVASTTPPIIPQFPTQTGGRAGGRRAIFIAVTLVLLVVVVGSALFVFMNRGAGKQATGGANNKAPAGAGATALLSFKDDAQGKVNGLTITSDNLPAPKAGNEYQGWIQNLDETFVPLGPVKQDGQKWALDFPGGAGVNLLANAVGAEITQETPGKHTAPSPDVLLKATFPSTQGNNYFTHIKHLLYKFPGTPHNVGLMVGLRDQATVLNAQAGLLKNVNSPLAERCVLWNLIDIIEGAKSPNYVSLQTQGCNNVGITQAGDTFGILGKSMGKTQDGYAALAAAHASLAATQPDSTDNAKAHQVHVQAAMDDTIEWGTKLDQDAQALLNNLGDRGKINEIVQMAGQLLNGFTAAGQEQPRPIKGEAGVLTGYTHALLMAGVDLKA